jgi:predicted kinase
LRRGEPFVWNATNVSKDVRSMTLTLFASYHARIRIAYLEAPPDVLAQRMKQRGRVVPARVIERMLDRWEIPDRTEAHEVGYHV